MGDEKPHIRPGLGVQNKSIDSDVFADISLFAVYRAKTVANHRLDRAAAQATSVNS
jgi:hypothetical protein